MQIPFYPPQQCIEDFTKEVNLSFVTPFLVSVIILCSIQAYVKYGVLYKFCEVHTVLATLSFKIIALDAFFI